MYSVARGKHMGHVLRGRARRDRNRNGLGAREASGTAVNQWLGSSVVRRYILIGMKRPAHYWRSPGGSIHKFDLRFDSSGGSDFLVDGRFLREMVFEGEDMEEREVSLLRRWGLWGLSSRVAQEQIRRLKGELPGQFFPQRVWLYFCPACFDEGCGGVSVRVQVGADQVVWSDFRHDMPSTEDEIEAFDDDDVITSVGTLVFDRVEYEAALNRTAKQLRRSFLPWTS